MTKRAKRKTKPRTKRRTKPRTKRKTKPRTKRKTKPRTKRKTPKKRSTNKKKVFQRGGNPMFYDNSPGIIELSAADFNDNRVMHSKTKGIPGIMMVYADWCPHCSNSDTQDAWKKLGTMVSSSSGWVGALNGADRENGNDKIMSNLGVKGFPSILFVQKNGNIVG